MHPASTLLVMLCIGMPGVAASQTLLDINPGPDDSLPGCFTGYDEYAYFAASTVPAGRELWKSDGTPEGTRLVADLLPGNAGGEPMGMTAAGGLLFFVARDPAQPTGPHRLWASDGTEAGTRLVTDLLDFPAPTRFTAFDGRAFFNANDNFVNGYGLWASDGTEAGTIRFDPDPASPTGLQRIEAHLYFSASTGEHGRELWMSDGTEEGTVMVKDIHPGSSGSNPEGFTELDGLVYFQADDGTHGSELWRTDGTEAGTVMVTEIRPGSSDSNPQRLTRLGNQLFFSAIDGLAAGDHGVELWKTDGTPGGTQLVKDIRAGSANSSPYLLAVVDDRLIFAADDGEHGLELWVSDGTEDGTHLLRDVRPGTGASFVINPGLPGCPVEQGAVLDGRFYVGLNDNPQGFEFELWASDGTEVGTVLVADLNPEAGSGATVQGVAGGRLYVSGFSPEAGNELWAMIPPAGAAHAQVSSDGLIDFGSETAVDVLFAGVSGSGTVSVERFTDGPANPVGLGDRGTLNPLSYRWILRTTDGLSVGTATEVRFAVDEIPSPLFSDPTSVTVYRRDTPGSGTFDAVLTSYDIGANAIVTTGSEAFGEFAFATSEVVANESAGEPPGSFLLSAAWPNPVRQSAMLTLTMADPGLVTIEAFDVLGRRVAILHDGDLAAGTHTLQFEVKTLPSGVYAVRATGRAGTQTRRVTRLR
ncbi:MAG: T9SS type A sorting domain-containing protein [Rhodothermaceae bacterium]|nr:T9SS type A sorting domain-containing protein [Rhodothermaceae bacterium]